MEPWLSILYFQEHRPQLAALLSECYDSRAALQELAEAIKAEDRVWLARTLDAATSHIALAAMLMDSLPDPR